MISSQLPFISLPFHTKTFQFIFNLLFNFYIWTQNTIEFTDRSEKYLNSTHLLLYRKVIDYYLIEMTIHLIHSSLWESICSLVFFYSTYLQSIFKFSIHSIAKNIWFSDSHPTRIGSSCEHTVFATNTLIERRIFSIYFTKFSLFMCLTEHIVNIFSIRAEIHRQIINLMHDISNNLLYPVVDQN